MFYVTMLRRIVHANNGTPRQFYAMQYRKVEQKVLF